MDIVSRLKMFLAQAGISNSQFADTCVIPRPTLSQLLNGRNKKVSDEIIAKIHRAYPSLNVMWLMFGDGEMLVSGAAPLQASAASSSGQDSEPRLEDIGQRPISFDVDEPVGYTPSSTQQTQRVTNPSTETIRSMMRTAAAANRGPKHGAGGDGSERRVTNIFVFYSDGRFERFELAKLQ